MSQLDTFIQQSQAFLDSAKPPDLASFVKQSQAFLEAGKAQAEQFVFQKAGEQESHLAAYRKAETDTSPTRKEVRYTDRNKQWDETEAEFKKRFPGLDWEQYHPVYTESRLQHGERSAAGHWMSQSGMAFDRTPEGGQALRADIFKRFPRLTPQEVERYAVGVRSQQAVEDAMQAALEPARSEADPLADIAKRFPDVNPGKVAATFGLVKRYAGMAREIAHRGEMGNTQAMDIAEQVPAADRELFSMVLAQVAGKEKPDRGFFGRLGEAVLKGTVGVAENVQTFAGKQLGLNNLLPDDGGTSDYAKQLMNIRRGAQAPERTSLEGKSKAEQFLSVVGTVAGHGAEAAAQMAPGMVGGVGALARGGPAAGFAWFYPQSSAAIYDELVGKGFSKDTSNKLALLMGIPHAAIDSLQAKGVMDAAKAKGLRNSLLTFGRKYAEELGGEAKQEAMELFAKKFAAFAEKEVPIDWQKEYGDSFKNIATAAVSLPFIMAGGPAGQLAGKAVEYRQQAQQAQQQADADLMGRIRERREGVEFARSLGQPVDGIFGDERGGKAGVLSHTPVTAPIKDYDPNAWDKTGEVTPVRRPVQTPPAGPGRMAAEMIDTDALRKAAFERGIYAPPVEEATPASEAADAELSRRQEVGNPALLAANRLSGFDRGASGEVEAPRIETALRLVGEAINRSEPLTKRELADVEAAVAQHEPGTELDGYVEQLGKALEFYKANPVAEAKPQQRTAAGPQGQGFQLPAPPAYEGAGLSIEELLAKKKSAGIGKKARPEIVGGRKDPFVGRKAKTSPSIDLPAVKATPESEGPKRSPVSVLPTPAPMLAKGSQMPQDASKGVSAGKEPSVDSSTPPAQSQGPKKPFKGGAKKKAEPPFVRQEGRVPVPESVAEHIKDTVARTVKAGNAKEAAILRQVIAESNLFDNREIDKIFKGAGAKLSDKGKAVDQGHHAHWPFAEARHRLLPWLAAEVEADEFRREAERQGASVEELRRRRAESLAAETPGDAMDEGVDGDTTFNPDEFDRPRDEPGNQVRPEPAQRLTALLEEGLARNDRLTDQQRQWYRDHFTKTIQGMPAKALAALNENVQHFAFYENVAALKAEVLERNPKLAKQLEGRKVLGAYFKKGGVLALDGEKGTETTSHEASHAIDGPKEVYSRSSAWKAAYQEEIKGGKLSDKADEHAREGWAEFGRLVYGLKTSAEELAKKFPQATAYWQAQGLIPEGNTGTTTQPAPAFGESVVTAEVTGDTALPRKAEVTVEQYVADRIAEATRDELKEIARRDEELPELVAAAQQRLKDLRSGKVKPPRAKKVQSGDVDVRVEELLAKADISGREKHVVKRLAEDATLDQIGKELGKKEAKKPLSRQRVQQIAEAAYEKLAHIPAVREAMDAKAAEWKEGGESQPVGIRKLREQAKQVDPNSLGHEGGYIAIAQLIDLAEAKKMLKGGVDWFASTMKKLFFGHMPKAAQMLDIKRKGQIKAMLKELGFVERDFRAAVQAEYGTALEKLPQADAERIDDALKGAVPLTALPLAVARQVQQMRVKVDELSQRLINEGLVDGDLLATVQANLGTYLTRSYQVFSDPKWKEKMAEGNPIRNIFKAWLRKEFVQRPFTTGARFGFVPSAVQTGRPAPNPTDAQLESIIDTLLTAGTAAEGPQAILRRIQVGKKDLSVLKERHDVPPELRALWGEVRNPLANYALSVGKMATMLANHQFLSEVRLQGQGVFLSEHAGEKGMDVQFEGGPPMSPLEGMYTFPEVKQAFDELFNPKNLPKAWQWYMRFNSSIKYGKTVGSPAAHAANFGGNPMFLLAQGNLGAVTKLPAVFQALASEVGVKESQATRDYLKRLVELGVVGDGIHANELQQIVGDALGRETDLDAFVNRLLIYPGRAQATIRAGRAVKEVAERTYEQEDAVWKILAFENEKARYQQAYPSWTAKQVEERAAQIVRNTMPTYSMVPELIKALRMAPFFVGDFISFNSEVVRVVYHTMKLITEEMGDSATRSIGARRLAGLVAAASIPAAASLATAFFVGMDDDDRDALRRFLAPWSKDAWLLYLGRYKDGSYRYVDTSRNNPFSYLWNPILAFAAGKDWEESLDKAAENIFKPFVGEGILAGAIFDWLRNKKKSSGAPVYNEMDSTARKMIDTGAHIWNSIEPSLLKDIRKVMQGLDGKPDVHPEAELLRMATGVGIKPANVEKSLGFKGAAFEKNERQAKQLLSAVAGKDGATNAEIERAYQSMERARQELFQELYRDYHAALRLGVAEQEAKRILQNAGLGESEVTDLAKGVYKPYTPGETYLAKKFKERRQFIVQLAKKQPGFVPTKN